MIRFCNLFSGSSGNSTYIETATTKILVDAGMSCQKISTALEKLNVSIKDIDGILISHEHTDHVKGIETITKKFGIPVYASIKTWDAMKNFKISDECKKFFVPNTSFSFGDVTVFPFSIPHDAVDPCAFNIFSDNKKLTVATDIGHLDDELIHNMYASDVLLIEANYDTNTLLYGPYPYTLKRRIQSDFGHLSNDVTSKAVKKIYENGTTNIVLGHLSKENNFPELAYQTVFNELQTSTCGLPFTLSVANRDTIDDVIEL